MYFVVLNSITPICINSNTVAYRRLQRHENQYIIECSFSIKPCSSKVWSLDHVAAHAMRYIKLRSVLHVLTDMTDGILKR